MLHDIRFKIQARGRKHQRNGERLLLRDRAGESDSAGISIRRRSVCHKAEHSDVRRRSEAVIHLDQGGSFAPAIPNGPTRSIDRHLLANRSVRKHLRTCPRLHPSRSRVLRGGGLLSVQCTVYVASIASPGYREADQRDIRRHRVHRVAWIHRVRDGSADAEPYRHPENASGLWNAGFRLVGDDQPRSVSFNAFVVPERQLA